MKNDEMIDKIVNLLNEAAKKGIENIPNIERFAIDALNFLLSPKLVLQQVALIAGLQVTIVLYQLLADAGHAVTLLLTEKGRKERKLMKQLYNAKSYREWLEIANQLDVLRGVSEWRRTEDSLFFDCKILKKRIAEVSDMFSRGDVFALMFRLRGGLARDQFGMQHEGLFSRALAGTKNIVENYHETMSEALNYICEDQIDDIPNDAKLAFFNEIRHAYGRTALLLSGGAYLGFYHVGVTKALFTEGLLPRVISGASAGSIVTAIVGTRTDEEYRDFFCAADGLNFPPGFRLDFFRYHEEPQTKIAKKLHYIVPNSLRWLSMPILSFFFEKKILSLDTEHLKEVLLRDVGPYTFQEAFDRTGRIINITVAPLNNTDPPRLLNYLTAPHVCVWSAAAASCALPGLFDAVSLIVKEPDGRFRPENEWTIQGPHGEKSASSKEQGSYSDGSLENDLPMQQLSELFNVNHFIVSQANPHSVFFSSIFMAATVWSNPIYSAIVGYTKFLMAQCRDWLKNVVNLFVFRSKAPVWNTRRGVFTFLTQVYEGRDCDVTVTPWLRHISPMSALLYAIKNPTNEEFNEVCHISESSLFPSLARIRIHCLIERTLDRCVQRLRKRIVEESERVFLAKQQAKGELNGRKAKDRTPSFYTTSSMVQLSGLGVADPIPLPTVPKLRTDSVDLTAKKFSHIRTNYANQKPPENSPDSPVGWNVGAELKSQNSLGGIFPSGSEDFSDKSKGVGLDSDFQDPLTVTVLAGTIPLAGNDDDTLMPENNPSPLTVETEKIGLTRSLRNYSSDCLKNEQIIQKSTHMANFYYKKSKSEEELSKMGN